MLKYIQRIGIGTGIGTRTRTRIKTNRQMSALEQYHLSLNRRDGKVKYLYHLSDIHIRNHNRHIEYRQVFNNLYTQLRKEEPGVIVVTGDIVHSKSQISPQLIIETRDFLTNLANIMPTMFIAGNHDLNLANKQLPDTLSSIMHKMDVDNLFYLKETGIYHWQNVSFAVMSVFDYPLIDASLLPADRKRVGLLHATVDQAMIGKGTKLENERYKVTYFKGYDAVLLGDIHLHQFLDKEKKKVGYAGSLVQQNYGEGLSGHGYVKWNLGDDGEESQGGQLVEVENEYGFLNMNLQNDKLVGGYGWNSNDISKKKVLRVKIQIKDQESQLVTAQEAIKQLRNKYQLEESMIIPYTPNLSDVSEGDMDDFNEQMKENSIHMEWQNLEGQKKFLGKFLEERLTSGEEKDITTAIESIKDLHEEIYRSSTQNLTDNGHDAYHWDLLSLEFNNCFSYSGPNYIDFTKFNGIVGIFGPNFSGKSNLLDILLFGLFDKCSRGERNDILTRGQDKMKIAITFKIGDAKYQIIREGVRNAKTGSVKIDVTFRTNGHVKNISQNLTGENRHQTNQIIQSYLGTYQDFILTTLKLQAISGGGIGTDLISLKNSERKERLVQLLKLELWDQYATQANNELRELKKSIQLYEKEVGKIPMDLKQKIKKNQGLIQSLNEDFKKANARFNKYYYQISEIKKRYHKVDMEMVKEYKMMALDGNGEEEIEVEEVNIEDLEQASSEIASIQQQMVELQSKRKVVRFSDVNKRIKDCNMDINKVKKATEKVKQKIRNLNGENEVNFDFDEKIVLESFQELLGNLKYYEAQIKEIESKSDKLLKLEYDPDCSYCMNNVFVKDARECQKRLIEIKQEYTQCAEDFKIMELIKDLVEKDSQMRELTTLLEEYQEDLDNHNFNKQLISENILIQQKLVVAEKNYNKIKENMKKWKLYTNIKNLQENSELDEMVGELEVKVKKYEIMKNEISEELIKHTSDLKIWQNMNDRLKELNQLLDEGLDRRELLSAYVQAVGKDGIPKFILEQSLPNFEHMVNLILENMVDFKIEMEMGEKKWNIYVIYDNKKLNVDLCSGYEKFMVSLATKIGLFHLSQMSKPRFMIIDEGFGSFDRENLEKFGRVYQFLRNKYKFVMLISHIDSMRYEVDQVLEIKVSQEKDKQTGKMNKFSRVNNRFTELGVKKFDHLAPVMEPEPKKMEPEPKKKEPEPKKKPVIQRKLGTTKPKGVENPKISLSLTLK